MQYIAETLVRYQRLQNDFEDARVRQAAAELSAELEAMRSALHPATELVIDDRQSHPSDEQALKMVQTFYRIFEPAKRDELLSRAERYASAYE